jgi:hypothetical protein
MCAGRLPALSLGLRFALNLSSLPGDLYVPWRAYPSLDGGLLDAARGHKPICLLEGLDPDRFKFDPSDTATTRTLNGIHRIPTLPVLRRRCHVAMDSQEGTQLVYGVRHITFRR